MSSTVSDKTQTKSDTKIDSTPKKMPIPNTVTIFINNYKNIISLY
jgi:hypothetical protein